MTTPGGVPRIAIADYGMGNLHSVRNAFESLGARVEVTSEASVLEAAPGVVLPGVGAFGDAMRELEARGIREVVRARAAEALDGGRPFLGICLGMQVLVPDGEEDPGVRGLGVVAGSCPRLVRPGRKVPHMGWNALEMRQQGNALFEGLPEKAYVYFVHSYHVAPARDAVVAATVDYDGPIVASIHGGRLHATQFHPEKSQAVGLRMLGNFIGLVPAA
ncbi:MAG: imidazole glycerol phosphate synthase subunit HisH [Candidatus Sumerlaeia bacterium]|nr:imidazole glycerol phosphate synthase subunit HisH [Candidatus Sumerlaeia bacterium]